MPNRILLALAKQDRLARFAIENPVARRMVLRFVAGEKLEDAVSAVAALNQKGIMASLDHLGENTSDRASARSAALSYQDAIDEINARGLRANISVKLTALGLDVGDAVAEENLALVLERAKQSGIFVRIDMEGSSYTARSLDVLEHLRSAGFDNTGPVIQAYLYRGEADVQRLIASGVRVRLCKGAYDEAPNIAFRGKKDTDRNFVRLMEMLLEHGAYPAIATHDEAIIEHARTFTQAHGIGTDRYEFQMLYGVRRDLQEQLVQAGYNVRVYVPYGTAWYPYLVRRLAERPANAVFLLGNAARDSRS